MTLRLQSDTHFPCRCRKCGARRTIRKPPDEYVRRAPRCSCGGRLRVDWHRKFKEGKRYRCDCGAWWFPHRRGSCHAGERYLLAGSINYSQEAA